MASDGESTGKSKGRTGQRDEADIDEHNQLETIPTMVPRKGDGYPLLRSGSVGQELGRIGELGCALTEDDLRRINTRKGFIQLLRTKPSISRKCARHCCMNRNYDNYKLNWSGFNGGCRATASGLRSWLKGAMRPGRAARFAATCPMVSVSPHRSRDSVARFTAANQALSGCMRRRRIQIQHLCLVHQIRLLGFPCRKRE